jgi:hypothetical protein
MKNVFFISLFIPFAQLASAQQNLLVQDASPMVRESNYAPAGDVTINDNSNIILNNYNSEEILVVVEDIMGNDIYSKIVFKNQTAVLKAEDPYNRIPSGVYTIVASSRNEIYNQKIVVD